MLPALLVAALVCSAAATSGIDLNVETGENTFQCFVEADYVFAISTLL